jgi:hypothetical protein
MLRALFHPHDQPPNVLYVYASVEDRLEHSQGRHDYQLDLEGSARLRENHGEFAVLLLDAQGSVLLESTEPVDRYRIHQLMDYRDGVPHPDDRTPGPPLP